MTMIQTGIVGACSKCNVICELEVPPGFDWKGSDRLQDRKTISAFCPRCQQMVEFIPRPLKNISGTGLETLGSIEKDMIRRRNLKS